MTTNPSSNSSCVRCACIAALMVAAGTSSLVAMPAAADQEAGSPRSPEQAVTDCMPGPGMHPVLFMSECHESQASNLRAARASADTRPAHAWQAKIAGLDLLAKQPGAAGWAVSPRNGPSPYDSPASTRAISQLRWTWASVSWKF